MSQEEVALQAEITTTHYGLVERDVKSPTVRMLEKICRALDYPISELFAENITCSREDDVYFYRLLNLLDGRTDLEKAQLFLIMKQVVEYKEI